MSTGRLKDMNEKDVRIGEVLRRYRIESGHSLSYVGNLLGVTKASVSYWESGQRSINMSTVLEIANKMGYDKEKFAKDLMDA